MATQLAPSKTAEIPRRTAAQPAQREPRDGLPRSIRSRALLEQDDLVVVVVDPLPLDPVARDRVRREGRNDHLRPQIGTAGWHRSLQGQHAPLTAPQLHPLGLVEETPCPEESKEARIRAAWERATGARTVSK